jgi:hypothetical protein
LSTNESHEKNVEDIQELSGSQYKKVCHDPLKIQADLTFDKNMYHMETYNSKIIESYFFLHCLLLNKSTTICKGI